MVKGLKRDFCKKLISFSQVVHVEELLLHENVWENV